MNTINLCGRLGHDPSLKTLDSGLEIVEFSLATNHQIKKGDEWVDATTWHRVKAFGKRAVAIKKWVSKGDQFIVIGRQENNKYEDKDGNTRWSSEVILNEFEFVGSRSTDSDEARNAQSQTSTDSSRTNHAPGAESPPSFNENEETPF